MNRRAFCRLWKKAPHIYLKPDIFEGVKKPWTFASDISTAVTNYETLLVQFPHMTRDQTSIQAIQARFDMEAGLLGPSGAPESDAEMPAAKCKWATNYSSSGSAPIPTAQTPKGRLPQSAASSHAPWLSCCDELQLWSGRKNNYPDSVWDHDSGWHREPWSEPAA